MAHHDAPSFRVSSESFQDGQTLPPAQRGAATGAGAKDESPQLSWSGAPAGTRGYAVTVFDPDAPGHGGFWHWAVLDLPADVTSLPAGAGSRQGGHLPPGAFQLRNDGGTTGYMGAAPPRGGRPAPVRRHGPRPRRRALRAQCRRPSPRRSNRSSPRTPWPGQA